MLLSALLVVAIVLVVLAETRHATVNRSNYNKISIGMHEAEVDALFEQPPVDLAPLNFQDVVYDETRENLLTKYPPPHTIKSWQGGRYLISVCLDRNGRVASKYYQRVPNPSVLDRVADWFGM